MIYWSKPHHGVQHSAGRESHECWCTVVDYNTFAILTRWPRENAIRGGRESLHKTVEIAKAKGERWLRGVWT